MKLLFSPTSPFARKVRITALETGLHGRIEMVPINTEDPNSGLAAHNPLRKIPVLETEFGPLYDSPVICEYLDTLHAGPKLFPAGGAARWQALRAQALADGLKDAALLLRYEQILRPADRQSDSWIERQRLKIAGALDRMEADGAEFDGVLTIGGISVACALGYLDFRFPDWDWRKTHPFLATWHHHFAARPSYTATQPPV